MWRSATTDQDEELVLCRSCGYDLRTCRQKRCPECSTEFDPSDPKTLHIRNRLRQPAWREGLVWIISIVILIALLHMIVAFMVIPLALLGANHSSYRVLSYFPGIWFFLRIPFIGMPLYSTVVGVSVAALLILVRSTVIRLSSLR